MSIRQINEAIHHLYGADLLRYGAGLTDGQLLEDYVSRGEEAALAALVRRHGPMVWGVCRRVLRDHQDAEDAWQATFLVLVRKASSIASRHLVANWLYGVAYRTARKAKAVGARRKGRERPLAEAPEPAAEAQPPWPDIRPLLDQELNRLPDKYRCVIVLCDLEEKTRAEVARHLNCPEGTVAGRLARARRMLAGRLARRGFAPVGAALEAALSREVAGAGPPAVSSSIPTATTMPSAAVVSLAEGVTRVMFLTKVKTAASLLAMVALLGAGGLVAWKGPAAASDAVEQARPQAPPGPLEDPKVVKAIKAEGGEVTYWKEGRDRWTKVEFLQDKGTDASLKHLKGLRHLQTLNLGKQFTANGLALLKDVTTVRTINLSCDVDDDGLAQFKGWINLEALSFSDMPVTGVGLKHLKGLPLKQVWIMSPSAPGARRFTDAGLVQLAAFANLELLSVSSQDVTDTGLESLKGMTGLRSLTLSSQAITDKGLAHLKPLAKGKLERLEVLSGGITDAGLDHLTALTNLKHLDLYTTGITDNGLAKLKGLSNLTALRLDDTAVTDAGLAHLKPLASSLEYVGLANTKVTDAGLDHLRGFTKLRHLNVTGTTVSDHGLDKLRKALPNVKVER